MTKEELLKSIPRKIDNRKRYIAVTKRLSQIEVDLLSYSYTPAELKLFEKEIKHEIAKEKKAKNGK
jgi:hypothetical protein